MTAKTVQRDKNQKKRDSVTPRARVKGNVTLSRHVLNVTVTNDRDSDKTPSGVPSPSRPSAEEREKFGKDPRFAGWVAGMPADQTPRAALDELAQIDQEIGLFGQEP